MYTPLTWQKVDGSLPERSSIRHYSFQLLDKTFKVCYYYLCKCKHQIFQKIVVFIALKLLNVSIIGYITNS